MRPLRLIPTVSLALASFAAMAQTATPPQNQTIEVNGERTDSDGKPIPMSDWWVAETPHVLVYSYGEADRLKRIAHNIEKLHFLLSMLFNRIDEPDDKVNLRVTLIGDHADFDKLDLANLRWQQGPYPRAVPDALYYDPREDGAVLAVPYTDQKILLQPSLYGRPSRLDVDPDDDGVPDVVDPSTFPADEVSVVMLAEGRIYAAYARHYLLTYFPAAYPRWYLEGFGEIFATLVSENDGSIEYGQQPDGLSQVNEKYGFFPVRDILSGAYLQQRTSGPRWTPYRAWALVHLLFFSDEWKQPLHNYLAAIARGASPEEATAAFGDIAKLERDYAAYRGRKVMGERLIFPPDRALFPTMRKLSRSEAAYVKGKLQLGARLELPPAPPPGADADTAARMTKQRSEAIARRDSWIADLREDAGRYAGDVELQLLLAEAECGSGNPSGCLAAAERALRAAPDNAGALTWKGNALVQQALAGPTGERKAGLKAARAWIVRANRADTEGVEPLIAYYRSFTDAGETPPDIAIDGLATASDRVPSAPETRLMLGEALARRGAVGGARRTLLPITNGAFDSPERAEAQAVLAGLGR
jgi:hypothetical protein